MRCGTVASMRTLPPIRHESRIERGNKNGVKMPRIVLKTRRRNDNDATTITNNASAELLSPRHMLQILLMHQDFFFILLFLYRNLFHRLILHFIEPMIEAKFVFLCFYFFALVFKICPLKCMPYFKQSRAFPQYSRLFARI